jgi:hypothetical protein
VIVTIAGVAITACHGDPRQLLALGVNVGDGMMLIAVVLYSGYTVFLRFKPDIHWKSLMLALAFFSFVTALPFAWWEIGTGRAIYPDMEGWAIAFYVALFPSALSQILYIRSNELIGGNRAALFINLAGAGRHLARRALRPQAGGKDAGLTARVQNAFGSPANFSILLARCRDFMELSIVTFRPYLGSCQIS